MAGPKAALPVRIHAIAAYRIGNLDEAIRLQSEACKLASDAEKPTFNNLLNYLKQCKTLRDGWAARSK